jgi:hypothetical protein
MGVVPYRQATLVTERLAPSLGWVRTTNLVIAILGTLLPAFAVYALSDKQCDGTWLPHWPEAIYIAVATPLLAYGAVRMSRQFGAVASRGRPLFAVMTFVPTLAHALGTSMFAIVVATHDLFHFCW